MHTQDYLLLAFAAFIIAAAFAFLPQASATGDLFAPYWIDLSGLNRDAGYLPEEEIPPH
jgi:hypothetical protein